MPGKHQPTYVAEPKTSFGIMGICICICVLMMNSVVQAPFIYGILISNRLQHHQSPLERHGCLERLMCPEPVASNGYSEPSEITID